MTKIKLGVKGRITIPKKLRDDLGLGAGAPAVVLRLGDGLILLPGQQRSGRLCERMRLSLTAAGLTPEDILATLPRARNRGYGRRYGKKRKDHAELPSK
jgi:AbrB family looped-hinge helix DNA binding protein